MGCNNYFDMTDQGDSFETWQGLRGPAGPQGPAGTPGAPGTSVELRGPVASVEDLPATASSSELWLVGTASPYDGWFYNGASWENAGQIAVGPTGPQGPAGQDGSDGVTFTPTVSSAGVISWTNDGSLPNPDPVDIKGPQGETGSDGSDGSNGATFTPSVSSDGTLSWTNDGGLPNPESVNIKGPQGQTGQTGPAGQDGSDGSNGATFTPSVSSAGVISWTNDGGLPNPQSVNIKGPQGATGSTGPAGPGVPTGGSTGQVLKKKSATDYDTEWQTENLNISGASVGDLVRISAVDNGKPTAFEKISDPNGNIGIVQNSDAATQNIAKDQYVIWHGALYTASADIVSGAALSSANLTAVSDGGLNDLRSVINFSNSIIWISGFYGTGRKNNKVCCISFTGNIQLSGNSWTTVGTISGLQISSNINFSVIDMSSNSCIGRIKTDGNLQLYHASGVNMSNIYAIITFIED